MHYSLGAQTALHTLGLVKTAAVPKALKQYRRAMEGFEAAARTMPTDFTPARQGFAAHGTWSLPQILDDGKLLASPLGVYGQHGGGVYWWRGFPQEHYLKGPDAEGILTDLASLPKKRPMMHNIANERGGVNMHMLRTGPDDYKLRPKDYAVINTKRHTEKGTLDMMRDFMRDGRLREMDSAIFDQAHRDFKNANMLKSTKFAPTEMPKTDKEVLDIYRKRVRPAGGSKRPKPSRPEALELRSSPLQALPRAPGTP